MHPVFVTVAQPTDVTGYLALAAQVEHWFGPMVNDAGFHRALVTEAVRQLDGPGLVEVVTFSHNHPAAAPSGARSFYERLGFTTDEPADPAPDGTPRQWYRKDRAP